MCNVGVNIIIVLTSIALTDAEGSAASGIVRTQKAMDSFIDELADKLLHRAFKPWSHADLDGATLAKAPSSAHSMPTMLHNPTVQSSSSIISRAAMADVLRQPQPSPLQKAADTLMKAAKGDFRDSILPGWFLVKSNWWFQERQRGPPTLAGKVALITGGSSGIGKAVARYLYNQGAQVVVTSRDLKRAQAACDDIRKDKGRGKLQALELDVSDLDSVRSFVEEFGRTNRKLHFFVENAGLGSTEELPLTKKVSSVSEQGYQIHYATNYLGHFLLLNLLMPTLKRSAPSRIVSVSSIAHFAHDSNLELMLPENNKKPMENQFNAYANSKFNQIVMCFELQRMLKEDEIEGIIITPVTPGITEGTGLTGIYPSFGPLMVTPQDSAMTTIHALLCNERLDNLETDFDGVFVQPFLTPLVSFFGGVDIPWIALFSQKPTWACHEWIRPQGDSYNKVYGKKLWEASAAAVGISPELNLEEEPELVRPGRGRRKFSGGGRRRFT